MARHYLKSSQNHYVAKGLLRWGCESWYISVRLKLSESQHIQWTSLLVIISQKVNIVASNYVVSENFGLK